MKAETSDNALHYCLVRVLVLCSFLLLPACAGGQTADASSSSDRPQVLRLATTTSTADAGLLEVILPEFERQYNARVKVVAVGTGQAITLGENGDVDVLLVHARSREDAFIAEGFGINRRDVMYNDFVIVGPRDDPAQIRGVATGTEALRRIAAAGESFVARGDESGTAIRELSLWQSAGISPTAELGWYHAPGQGMGATLTTANEMSAYTLTDRGTFLAMRDKLFYLEILVGGDSLEENQDPNLLNPYSVIPVNPERHEQINGVLAEQFAAWLTSPETQQTIRTYGRDIFGQPLFYTDVNK